MGKNYLDDGAKAFFGNRWLARYAPTTAPSRGVHIANALDSSTSFCGIDSLKPSFLSGSICEECAVKANKYREEAIKVTPGCWESARVDGLMALCSKDEGHTKSKDPAEREHYDPSVDRRWNAEADTEESEA